MAPEGQVCLAHRISPRGGAVEGWLLEEEEEEEEEGEEAVLVRRSWPRARSLIRTRVGSGWGQRISGTPCRDLR